jgi:hypothetical protein
VSGNSTILRELNFRTYILVPHSQYQRLLIELIGAGLKEKLFVKHRIQVSPFNARLVLLPMRIGL